jgi:hypothetical protein
MNTALKTKPKAAIAAPILQTLQDRFRADPDGFVLELLSRPAIEQECDIHLLRTDGKTQVRDSLNEDTVQNYTEARMRREVFPPVDVMIDPEGNLWLWNGFHRRAAELAISGLLIRCRIIEGTLEEAQILALQANKANPLQLNNASKQKIAKDALPRFRPLGVSISWISGFTGLSTTTLKNWEKVLLEAGKYQLPEKTIVIRGDQTYEQDTAKIGVRLSFESLRDRYEPWGVLARANKVNVRFTLTQRVNLIADFANLEEADGQFDLLTGALTQLKDLPPGEHRCNTCTHRQLLAHGDEWQCSAKGSGFTHGAAVDWALENNGDCRLYSLANSAENAIAEGDFVYGQTKSGEKVKGYVNKFVTGGAVLESGDFIWANSMEIMEPDFDPSFAPSPKKQPANPLLSSDKEEHFTPKEVALDCHYVMDGIELDIASCATANEIIKAERFFSKADNALMQELKARTGFCNPPGGKLNGRSQQALFWDHVHACWVAGVLEEAIFLGFSLELLSKRGYEILNYPICITCRGSESEVVNGMGRMKFLDQDLKAQDSPTHGNFVVYLPPRGETAIEHQKRFLERFSKYGKTGLLGGIK